ncbi:MAG: DUF2971 domain-containing protein [Chitinophagales bacterium]|nr:DUF2971 domain-containing protein [Chitinophagales bacterium]
MEFLGNIPNILYKYRVWEDPYQKRILTHNELYFASADQFNDPFDASLPMRYDKAELTKENIIKKLVLLGRNKWTDISEDELLKRAEHRYKTGGFDTDEYWRNFHAKFKEDTNKMFGICSLTSKNDNLLMWSHYANSHKGFCIGFDKFELYETTQGMVGNISYSNTFPTMPMFDPGFGGMAMLIMTKSTHWEYEDEYRITKIFAARKIFTIKDTAIKEIVFGCRMSKQSKAEMLDIIKTKKSDIKVFDTVVDDTTFKLNLVSLK